MKNFVENGIRLPQNTVFGPIFHGVVPGGMLEWGMAIGPYMVIFIFKISNLQEVQVGLVLKSANRGPLWCKTVTSEVPRACDFCLPYQQVTTFSIQRIGADPGLET